MTFRGGANIKRICATRNPTQYYVSRQLQKRTYEHETHTITIFQKRRVKTYKFIFQGLI